VLSTSVAADGAASSSQAHGAAQCFGGELTPRQQGSDASVPLRSTSAADVATPADALGPAAAQGSGQPTAATLEPIARAPNQRKRRSRDLDAKAPEWAALRLKAPPVLRRRIADDYGDEDAHPDGEAGKAGKGGNDSNRLQCDVQSSLACVTDGREGASYKLMYTAAVTFFSTSEKLERIN